jgi:hypothetical protein
MKHLLIAAAVLAASAGLAFADTTKPIAPIPTAITTVTPPESPDNFTFVVTGDNRPPGAGDPIMPVFDEICKEISLIRPNFVFWTGDCIYGYSDTPDAANSEYDDFLKTVSLCNVPVFNAIGNHEATSDPNMETIYIKRMGALYGSMDYGNSHFISLNTDPIVDGKVIEGTIDPDQMAWLKADLAANSKAANIFVFMHHYVFGPPDPDDPAGLDTGFATIADRDALHKVFVQYGVRAVFCGHAHLYFHAVHDSVDYYISGNAGAPLDADPENGGYFGYMMVTVNGSKIDAVERAADTLYLRRISGDDGKSSTAVVAVDAPYKVPTTLDGITVEMPAGKTCTVSASATNKAKTKVVKAVILGTEAAPDGNSVLVRIGATLPGSRTTIFTVKAN